MEPALLPPFASGVDRAGFICYFLLFNCQMEPLMIKLTEATASSLIAKFDYLSISIALDALMISLIMSGSFPT